MAGSHDSSILVLWGISRLSYQSGSASLHPKQQYRSTPSPHIVENGTDAFYRHNQRMRSLFMSKDRLDLQRS